MMRESSHDTVNELLPWYANQTLSREDCAVAEEHLAHCANCTQELQHLYEIGAAMKFADEATPARTSFAQTLAAIEEWENSKPRSVGQRVGAWLHTLWTPSAPVARIVFAAQLGIILIMAGVFLIPRLTEKPYTTLSGGGAQGSGGVRLDITFEPSTTEETMRKVLLDSGCKLVSGPSALGVYVVELAGTPVDDPKLETEIARLRSMTGVVRFVERQP
jgi:hypothetical protein